MKIICILILTMGNLALANETGNNSGYSNRSIVKCSSNKNHRKTCHANTSGGVKLVEQLSRASCHNNWGYSQNQIWVDNGCRAKFQLYTGNGNNGGGHNNSQSNSSYNNNAHNNSNNNNYNNNNTPHNNNNSNYNNAPHNNNNGYNNQSYGNRIICESIKSRRNTCSIPDGSSVSLSKQLSHSSCGNNWGYDNHQIWVTNGCRAEFTINSGGH